MRLLKAFVVGMAVLIALGIAVLAWGLTHSWTERAPATATSGTQPAYTAIDLTAPPGTHFEQMSSTADRVLLRFSGPHGERIMVVDPISGRVTGNIAVAPAEK